MDPRRLETLARRLVDGEFAIDVFIAEVTRGYTADVGDAQVDLDRRRRCGFPEVIFGEGKSLEAIEKIARTLAEQGVDVLATRITAEQAAELVRRFPGALYNPVARTFRVPLADPPEDSPFAAGADNGRLCIVTAGTSDRPVGEEARETALWMGVDVDWIQDVGVAGPHRLPVHLHKLEQADAVVVVAGMEGALPSVVGGYVACPVIAVPTSVGYGASFGGIAALLGMLNSCASNVSVVNIDAGFKGAYVAGLIARNAAQRRRSP